MPANFLAKITSKEECLAFLGDTDHKRLGHNTYATRRGNSRTILKQEENPGIVYHETVVVTYTDDGVILDSGGWDSVTTRDRMNAFTPEWIVIRWKKGSRLEIRIGAYSNPWKPLVSGTEYKGEK